MRELMSPLSPLCRMPARFPTGRRSRTRGIGGGAAAYRTGAAGRGDSVRGAVPSWRGHGRVAYGSRRSTVDRPRHDHREDRPSPAAGYRRAACEVSDQRRRHMAGTEPVTDWTTDFDVLDAVYVRTRSASGTTCARPARSPTPTGGGAPGCPTTYEDVTALAHDIEHFSSLEHRGHPRRGRGARGDPVLPYGLPPISADPPAAHLDPSAPAAVVLPPPGGRATSR